MRKFNPILSLVFASLMILGIMAPVFAAKTNPSTIYIKNKEDLYKLAKDASLDKYSEDLTVILKNDIDLKRELFKPIPIFNGSFDGNGYKIKGILIEAEGSNQGFIRYLGEKGLVKDLTLEAVITPKGDRANIGGIVGYNRGKIDNCHFSGMVRGKNTIGAIAGYNSTSGKIINSSSDSLIYGERKVGGIAGVNGGLIHKSINKGEINTTVEEDKLDIQELTSEDLSFSKVFTDATDIGGIAGSNTGVIQASENHGKIGYTSVGYNIGGIAGRQSGYIDTSVNYGNVFGRKDVGGLVGQVEPNVKMTIGPSKLGELNSELSKLQAAINKFTRNSKVGSAIISEDLEGLQKDVDEAMIHLKSLMEYAEKWADSELGNIKIPIIEDGQIPEIPELPGLPEFPITEDDLPEFETPDDSFSQAKDGLFDSIEDISSSLSKFTKNIDKQSKILMENMEEMNNSLFRVMNLMFDILDELYNKEAGLDNIVEDVSDKDIDKITEGKVYNSKNYGAINADLNVGGIAGAMSIDLELDPEDDINISGRFTANTVFQTRAILDQCENYGNIIGKKNHIGGVVGNMELGYIRGSLSSATIQSTSGNYVGGIAGRSLGPIHSAYSKSNLEGGNYIGGISGLAREITDSYSLVNIQEARAYLGAIAGNVEENSSIKGNFFVSNKLHGIDGISYKDKAEPISYDKLLDVKGIPSIFKKFKLSFWADDKLIDTMEFNYGDDLSETDLPEIPDKKGYYGEWEDVEIAGLEYDNDVYAKYMPYISLLESSEMRHEKLPLILVEGKFIEGDSLKLKQLDSNEAYRIEIPHDGSLSHTLRYLPLDSKGKYNIFIEDNGSWLKQAHKMDGKYLVFKVEGNTVTFKVDKAEKSFRLVYLVLILISLFIGGFIILKKHLQRKVGQGEA